MASLCDQRRHRRRQGSLRWMIVAIAPALALGACGSGTKAAVTTSSSGVTTTSSATTGSTSAGGCGTSVASGSTTLTPKVGGRARTVIVHVPAGYTGSAKVALVLNMHGSGSTAAEQEGLTGMDSTSDANGFIVAYPQGLIPEGSGYGWNVPGVPLFGGQAAPPGSPDDVSFLIQLVGVLKHDYCIDAARVYATGFSGGARMSSQLACDASNIFAAVAPVSGLRIPTPCPATRPVPVVAFHGTADPVDPYGGHGQAYWTYSVPEAAQRWAEQDGCSASARTSTPDPSVTLSAYSGCRGGAGVELYSITGEGHEWPGGPHLRRRITRVLGPQTTAVDADDTMWAFFMAHPLR